MKDMVTNGTGNSRYLKTSLASGTTWESALAMLREGTFPIDLNGLNNGGITQLGSAYSKANVLPDDVCALLGLDSTTAEPKDAFGVVGNPAELWVWEKYLVLQESSHSNQLVVGTVSGNNVVFIAGMTDNNSNYSVQWEYSDSIKLLKNGTIELVNPRIITVTHDSTNVATTLRGKYIRPVDTYNKTTSLSPEHVYYIPSGVSFYKLSYGNNGGTLRDINGTLFYWGGYTSDNIYVVIGLPYILENNGYVVSLNSSEYPEDGQSGDYWYTRLGQIGGCAHIETGSYVGTGTYGSSNPNSLTFEFAPKVVFIYPNEPSRKAAGVVAVYGAIYAIDYYTSQNISIIWSNKQMSWYSESAPGSQFNGTGVKYIYVAIG